jgi:hypothetical protein
MVLIKATVPCIRGRALLRTTAVDIIHGDGAESFWCHRAAVTIDIAVGFARLQDLSDSIEHQVWVLIMRVFFFSGQLSWCEKGKLEREGLWAELRRT